MMLDFTTVESYHNNHYWVAILEVQIYVINFVLIMETTCTDTYNKYNTGASTADEKEDQVSAHCCHVKSGKIWYSYNKLIFNC